MIVIRTNECVSDNIDNSTGISQRLPLLSILYLFYNTDLIEIFCTNDEGVITNGFIDDVFLLEVSSSILRNCQLPKKKQSLFMALAKRYTSKFDQVKYQLVYLSGKKNIKSNTKIVLTDSHTIKVQTSGVVLGVKTVNDLRSKQNIERIKVEATMNISILS